MVQTVYFIKGRLKTSSVYHFFFFNDEKREKMSSNDESFPKIR